mmetsp:Transcript_6925/g.19605  ORF Transcript_6925/g.19605 Transcript_6925/m.19605 type:complete len:204 (+) Transcript_6925:398-1009(+)
MALPRAAADRPLLPRHPPLLLLRPRGRAARRRLLGRGAHECADRRLRRQPPAPPLLRGLLQRSVAGGAARGQAARALPAQRALAPRAELLRRRPRQRLCALDAGRELPALGGRRRAHGGAPGLAARPREAVPLVLRAAARQRGRDPRHRGAQRGGASGPDLSAARGMPRRDGVAPRGDHRAPRAAGGGPPSPRGAGPGVPAGP